MPVALLWDCAQDNQRPENLGRRTNLYMQSHQQGDSVNNAYDQWCWSFYVILLYHGEFHDSLKNHLLGFHNLQT